ncbi:putative O-glycosylation ligase, exosortase A system-associated [Pseudorhodoferax sp.]|uniref:putative O-glycosylation ligase, exosortase A system-associated n=1 Tax=Pseudorhodoferax sp. TaxID=1993553 RepID=UPI0039E4D609
MMFIIVPITLSNAFAAYLVWGWTSVIAVPFYMYGFMGSLRYNLFFALITLMFVLIGKVHEKGRFTLNPTSGLILLFMAHVSVSAVLAKPSAVNNFSIYSDLVKSVTYCLLMCLFVTSRLRLHAMMIAIALGLGFHGLAEGLKTLVTAGGHKVIGLPGTKMSDNNHFGVALVMVLPILLYLYQYSKVRVVRLGFLGVLVATVLAIVGSNSRGAFVAMAMFALVLVLTTRRKVLTGAMVVAGVVLVLVLSPERWFERIETIGTASDDASFMGRVEAWNVATALALKNPVFGTGFHAMQSPELWFGVRPADGLLFKHLSEHFSTFAKAAHSIYFEVLGDHGFVGLLIFLCVLFNCFLTARHVRQLTKGQPTMLWARDMADALGLSILAFAVGGAAVSLAYFETFYVVACLLECLRQFVLRHGSTSSIDMVSSSDEPQLRSRSS